MKIVKMDDSHPEQIARFEELYFSAPWSEKSIRSELKNPLSLWLVALQDEKVIGYVGSQSVLGEADMMNLAVSLEYRRNGVARALVTRLIENLAENQIHALTLEVRASNNPAISLYDSLGFVQVGRRPNYYQRPKEDAFILRKEWEV